MARARIKWNIAGFRELRREEPGVIKDIQDRTDRIAAAAGADYEAQEVWIGRNRARGTVRTLTAESVADESANGTLTRALDAGR